MFPFVSADVFEHLEPVYNVCIQLRHQSLGLHPSPQLFDIVPPELYRTVRDEGTTTDVQETSKPSDSIQLIHEGPASVFVETINHSGQKVLVNPCLCVQSGLNSAALTVNVVRFFSECT